MICFIILQELKNSNKKVPVLLRKMIDLTGIDRKIKLDVGKIIPRTSVFGNDDVVEATGRRSGELGP